MLGEVKGDPRLIPGSGSRVREIYQGFHTRPNQSSVRLVYFRDWDVRMQADMI